MSELTNESALVLFPLFAVLGAAFFYLATFAMGPRPKLVWRQRVRFSLVSSFVALTLFTLGAEVMTGNLSVILLCVIILGFASFVFVRSYKNEEIVEAVREEKRLAKQETH